MKLKLIGKIVIIGLTIAFLLLIAQKGTQFFSQFEYSLGGGGGFTVSKLPVESPDSDNKTSGTKNEETIEIDEKISTPGPLRKEDSEISAEAAVGEIESRLTEEGIIKLTNQQRKQNGDVSLLVENILLSDSAEKKLEDMFTNQYFEHVSPATSFSIEDLVNQVEYEYIIIGENLALGTFKSDEDVVEAWMDSPGHRANILNSRYTEIGVAARKDVFDGNEVWIAVQHFGTPLSTCAQADQGLKIQIDINQQNIEAFEKVLGELNQDIENSTISFGESYQAKVNAYNDIVQEYNILIGETQNKVSLYNNQVESFNTCVQGI